MAVNFIKVGDAAAMLGVSEQAVRLWCRTGVLPAYRPSGTKKWLIDPDEFAAWCKRRPVVAVLESLHADYRSVLPDHQLANEAAVAADLEDRHSTTA